MKCVRLPLTFDPHRLRADLDCVLPGEWVAHFNTGAYDGDWSGVSLRGVDGRAGHIYPDHTATERYTDTPVLARCPYFREVLADFQCQLTSVRLLKLAARSNIREHRDYKLAHEHGEVRIHIPIVTNERVAFFLDGERVPMAAGEAWYLNLELPHRVDNESDSDRVHVVVDCLTNDWLDGLLMAGVAAAPPMAHAVTAPPPARADAAPPVARTIPARERSDREGEFATLLTATIAGFLRAIGLAVEAGAVPERTFVPGIWIDRGMLVVDEERVCFPGDLLHEAGHLAVMPPSRRPGITGDASSDAAEEMLAIAWSYAAALHLGLDPALVFHTEGYRGSSDSLLENFAQGRYLAVPLLQWLGMTYDETQAAAHDAQPYPKMIQWLRTKDV